LGTGQNWTSSHRVEVKLTLHS